MKRAIVKFSNGDYCNLPADYMDCDDTLLSIYCEDNLVGVFKVDEVVCAYISEKGKE